MFLLPEMSEKGCVFYSRFLEAWGPKVADGTLCENKIFIRFFLVYSLLRSIQQLSCFPPIFLTAWFNPTCELQRTPCNFPHHSYLSYSWWNFLPIYKMFVWTCSFMCDIRDCHVAFRKQGNTENLRSHMV